MGVIRVPQRRPGTPLQQGGRRLETYSNGPRRLEPEKLRRSVPASLFQATRPRQWVKNLLVSRHRARRA